MEDLLDDNYEITLNNNKDIAAANKLKLDLNENLKAVFAGLGALVVLIIFLLISGIFSISKAELPIHLVIIEVGFFIFLYIVSILLVRKNPVAGLVLGLCTYLLFIGIYALVDPNTFYRGYLFKSIILIILLRGIYNAQKIKTKTEKLKKYGLSEEDKKLIKKLKALPKINYIKNK